jgi:cytochrome b
MKTRILVWDLPTRWFHWLLALSFAGAWLTADSERYRDIHVMLGYSFLGLIAFRLVYGVVGSRYARFSEFVRSPAAAVRYLKSLVSGKAEHYVGHNPAGAIAILLLLALGIASGISGWMTYNEIGGEWLEEGHELFSNLMLAVVGLHVAGVIAGSLAHRENLVRAMVTGYKQGEPEQGIGSKRLIVASVLLALMAGFWGLWLNDKASFTQPDQLLSQQAGGMGDGNHSGRRDRLHDDDG